MGINIFYKGSECSCPSPSFKKAEQEESNYIVLRQYGVGDFSAFLMQFKGATNYGGLKVLVFTESVAAVTSILKIDPHFCENAHISPVARFEPTDRGWAMAVSLVNRLTGVSK